jgi:hypothetical protein
MHRLPSYDVRTSKAEHYVFLGLSLAAVGLIAITTLNASRFSIERQGISAALSKPSATLRQRSSNDESTNLVVFPSGPAEKGLAEARR